LPGDSPLSIFVSRKIIKTSRGTRSIYEKISDVGSARDK
ncbi:MAG: hypothetical protein FD143_3590, partial [Ignavibacteria bacterium]